VISAVQTIELATNAQSPKIHKTLFSTNTQTLHARAVSKKE